HASSTQGVLQPIIPLMTGVLPEWSRDLVNRHFSRPGSDPHPRILHGKLVENGVLAAACDPFSHVQVLGSRERTQICEIGGVDHQSIALPVPDRVAHPLMDVPGQMRPAQANDTGVMDLLGLNGHVSGTLYDLKI